MGATPEPLGPGWWPEQQPPRQDALSTQLADLHRVAARLGMYDAADWLWQRIPKPNPTMTRPRCRKCGTPGPHCACGAMDWT